jgi:hypothetical protein
LQVSELKMKLSQSLNENQRLSEDNDELRSSVEKHHVVLESMRASWNSEMDDKQQAESQRVRLAQSQLVKLQQQTDHLKAKVDQNAIDLKSQLKVQTDFVLQNNSKSLSHSNSEKMLASMTTPKSAFSSNLNASLMAATNANRSTAASPFLGRPQTPSSTISAKSTPSRPVAANQDDDLLDSYLQHRDGIESPYSTSNARSTSLNRMRAPSSNGVDSRSHSAPRSAAKADIAVVAWPSFQQMARDAQLPVAARSDASPSVALPRPYPPHLESPAEAADAAAARARKSRSKEASR